MRVPLGVPVLVGMLVMLAGCLFPPPVDEGPAPFEGRLEGEGAAVLPWVLRDCRFLNWFVETTPESLAPYLPEGLVPAMRESETGDVYSVLGFEAFECASGYGLEGYLSDMRYASLFIPVEVEDDDLVAAADGEEPEDFYVKLFPLIPDDARRAAFAQRGLAAVDGVVAFDAPVADGVERLHGVSYTLDGVGTFAFDGVSPMAGPFSSTEGGGRFAEFSPLGDDPLRPDSTDLVYWQAEYEVHELHTGEGTWTADASSIAADILGATSGDASFITGRWTYEAGSVTFPAREP